MLFSQDGTAKLADLGIVRFSRPGSKADVHKTRVEAVVGTPAYMSPEQMLDSHAVDIRSDIYSLGVMMYEMLAGRRLNEGLPAMSLLAKALDGQTFPDIRTRRSDVPPELAELVASMTHPEAARRPASARALLEALARSRAAAPAVAWYRDRSVLYALAALVLACLALIVALLAAIGGGV